MLHAQRLLLLLRTTAVLCVPGLSFSDDANELRVAKVVKLDDARIEMLKGPCGHAAVTGGTAKLTVAPIAYKLPEQPAASTGSGTR